MCLCVCLYLCGIYKCVDAYCVVCLSVCLCVCINKCEDTYILLLLSSDILVRHIWTWWRISDPKFQVQT